MTNCKKENCSAGWLFNNDGDFIGRCDCFKERNLDTFFSHSNINERHKKRLSELEDSIVYPNLSERQVSYKKMLSGFIAIKDKLIKKNAVINLKGYVGTGKSQFAATLAIELFMKIDWNLQDIYLQEQVTPFFSINLMELVSKNELYDKEKIEYILHRVENSKILILEELGDELNITKTATGKEDKRKIDVLELLKTILDKFNGLLIYTTNHFDIEEEYKKYGRMDIYSRLFQTESSEYFQLAFDSKKDMRSKQDEELESFKKEFGF